MPLRRCPTRALIDHRSVSGQGSTTPGGGDRLHNDLIVRTWSRVRAGALGRLLDDEVDGALGQWAAGPWNGLEHGRNTGDPRPRAQFTTQHGKAPDAATAGMVSTLPMRESARSKAGPRLKPQVSFSLRVVGATDECRHHSGDAPITNAILVVLGNTCRMFSKSFGRSNVLETVASLSNFVDGKNCGRYF
jgi:hypothetical protein